MLAGYYNILVKAKGLSLYGKALVLLSGKRIDRPARKAVSINQKLVRRIKVETKNKRQCI